MWNCPILAFHPEDRRMRCLLPISLMILIWSGCTYTLPVRDGDTAADRLQFATAVDFYLRDLEKAKTRVERGRIALKLADAYTRMNQPGRALLYYQQAWNDQAGVSALRGKAYALKTLERYEEAIEAFRQLGEEIGSSYEYRRDIQACESAAQWRTERSSPHTALTLLELNSRYADYAPFPLPDGRLVFTSDRPSPQQKGIYAWTGKPFSGIFVGDPDGRAGALPTPAFLATINTAANEGVPRMDHAGNLYFTRCGQDEGQEERYCRLFIATRNGDDWLDPERLPFCTGAFNYGHAAPTPDGQMLFFSCDDPSGMGGYDIYMTLRTSEGWLEPVMLPPTINTPGDEVFPWMDADTLYFASDHHLGMGGLDLFKSYRLGGRSWSSPENLRPPFNSGADDFGFLWAGAEQGSGLRYGYLSSSRPGGIGDDDIYRIAELEPIAEPEPEEPVTEFRFELDIYTLTRIFQQADDPNSPVLGRRPVPGASIRISGELDSALVSNAEGSALVPIRPGGQYALDISAPGFLNARARFDAQDIRPDPRKPLQRFELEVILERRFVEKEIVLENIYYDFDRWEIRPDAEPTLNKLAAMLQANPDIVIELASHTDCRGAAAYNQELSQRRAQSAVDYLIGKGIASGRLRARGYGKSRPAVDCICSRCTEAEHQTNRRTTFRILEN